MCLQCKAIIKLVSFGFRVSEIEQLMAGQEIDTTTDAGYESYKIVSLQDGVLVFRQNFCGHGDGCTWTHEDFEYQL